MENKDVLMNQYDYELLQKLTIDVDGLCYDICESRCWDDDNWFLVKGILDKYQNQVEDSPYIDINVYDILVDLYYSLDMYCPDNAKDAFKYIKKMYQSFGKYDTHSIKERWKDCHRGKKLYTEKWNIFRKEVQNYFNSLKTNNSKIMLKDYAMLYYLIGKCDETDELDLTVMRNVNRINKLRSEPDINTNDAYCVLTSDIFDYLSSAEHNELLSNW